VTATIDLSSIDTNNAQRDDDLRSANFLEIETHPTMTYRSTGIRHSEDGFDVDGELTLHGLTRQVPLALDVNGFTRDPFGGIRAGFSATTEIDRRDFGITFNVPMDGGGVVVGEKIQIFIEIEAILAEPQADRGRRAEAVRCRQRARVRRAENCQSVSRFNLRQPPARLLAMICLNMAVRARALIVSPWRTATVRAVLLPWPPVMIPLGSGTMPPS
jgi:YceI-like domain